MGNGIRLLSGSVGIGCDNRPGDISVVRFLLNRHIRLGALKGEAELDDDCELLEMEGDATIEAIMEVQRILEQPKIDGVCSRQGGVLRYIAKSPVGMPKTEQQLDRIMDMTSHALACGPIADIREELWIDAIGALRKRAKHEKLIKPHLLTIVDFTLGIRKERLWTFDLERSVKLLRTRVAHGRGPRDGKLDPPSGKFSDGACRSAVGSFITQQVFPSTLGRKANDKRYTRGPAMVVIGLDKSNNRSKTRGVRFHSGHYMENGRTGKSKGCFVTNWDSNRMLCSTIADGSFVYAACRDRDHVPISG